jgi:type II secretory pathway pseudopilin PulG
MKYPDRSKMAQMGMTMWQMMFVLIIVGFVATAAIKMGPAYVDNHVVVSALDDIQKSYAGSNMQEVKDQEILTKLEKYFEVNQVSDVIEKSAKVTRVKQQVILSINYEIRSNFMGNVDTVLVFKNEVDLATP